MAQLNDKEKRFCELYLLSGNSVDAFRASGLEVSFGFDERDMIDELLSRSVLRDHLAMMGDSGSDDIEVCIKRLEVLRRSSWREGNVKLCKDIELEIAKLRGWLIERKEVKTANLNITGASNLSSSQLLEILSSSAGRAELNRQGLLLENLV